VQGVGAQISYEETQHLAQDQRETTTDNATSIKATLPSPYVSDCHRGCRLLASLKPAATSRDHVNTVWFTLTRLMIVPSASWMRSPVEPTASGLNRIAGVTPESQLPLKL
jgi:hypothetical protein